MTEKLPTISIIGGKGKMGQLFASFFQDHGLNVLVSDLNTKLTNKEAAEKGDIVIVAVTLGLAEKVIKEIAPYVRKDALLADITSVKEAPVKAMAKCKGEILGMHPMFGASNAIPGQLIIMCPVRSGKYTAWLRGFFKAKNVKLIELSPKEHDRQMTYAQGLIHFAEIAFMHTLFKLKKKPEDVLKYTGIASDIKVLMAGRLIAQDPELYGNIAILNPQSPQVIKQFIKSSEELLKIVKKKNLKKFVEYFDNSKNFAGEYAQESYKESAWIIDQVLARRREELHAAKMKRQTQKPNKNAIGVLGPKGTFSSLAASKYEEKSPKIYFDTIDEVFKAVEEGKVKEGIVPIENKIHGTVRESLDALFYKNVHIVGELNLPIEHCLIGLAHGKPRQIREIISHTQALHQCKKYLDKNFPKAKRVAYASTAAAVQKMLVSQNVATAAVAPADLANDEMLKVFARNIEDQKGNTTKFFIIQKGSTSADKKALKSLHIPGNTSIAFYFGQDSPGSLFTVFKDFAEAKINLTKIESRPTSKSFGQYIFYLDFDGNISDKNVAGVLKKVEAKVKKLKVLGSY